MAKYGELLSGDDKNIVSKKEMYEILLKEFEECADEGREHYLEEILAELRKDLEAMEKEE
jgi:hypothetical protein